MQSDAHTLYKLIILYMLDKVDFPLTNAQISNFMLEKEYTNYFTIQQAVSELVESELIHMQTIRNSSYYHLNPSGAETLSFFGNKISDAIINDIKEYLKKNKFKLREEVSTIADYFEEKTDEFIVRCQIKENGSAIIDLNLSVPAKEEAETICHNWKKKSQDLYSYLIRALMTDS